jgi:hypothetical protein
MSLHNPEKEKASSFLEDNSQIGARGRQWRLLMLKSPFNREI